jgi:protease PrsW
MYVAMVLAALVPVFTCYAVRWWLGRDHLQPIWLYPVVVLAGGVGGLVFGIFGSGPLQEWFPSLVATHGAPLAMLVVIAPLAEEIGKALILLLVLRTVWYRSAIDGALFGLAAGTGFATFENLSFFVAAEHLGSPFGWTTLAAVRLIPSTLIHGGTTALVGAYLGAVRWEKRPLVIFTALPGALLVATLLHGAWNGMMELATSPNGVTHALAAWAALPAFAALLLVVLRLAHRAEKGILRQELEPVVREGLLTPAVLEAVLDRHMRRRRRRLPQQRAVVELAFALRRTREERRGAERVSHLRRLLARFALAPGRLRPQHVTSELPPP